MHTTTTTFTATCDCISGIINVHVPSEDTDLAIVNGRTVFTFAEIEPWGAEEYEMDRADTALAQLGWTRTSEWAGTNPFLGDTGTDWACQVRPHG